MPKTLSDSNPFLKPTKEDWRLSYRERREKKTTGVVICDCGGVMYRIDGKWKCGDCGPWIDRRAKV